MKRILLFTLCASSVACTYAQNTWSQKANVAGSTRQGAIAFSIGSKGYVGTGAAVIGRDVNTNLVYSNLKDFWEYDPATNTWTQKADFGGTARNSAVGFSIGSKGYVGTGSDGVSRKDFWEYDPSANSWLQKADFGGTSRYSAVGFNIGSIGYIGTGFATDGIKKDFWEYDPAVNTWLQKADFGGLARYSATGFSIIQKGYIGTGVAGSFVKDFWEYDPAFNAWIRKADFGGTARFGSSSFSIGSKGYIGIGSDAVTSQKDLWEYNSSSNTWIKKADYGGVVTFGARYSGIGLSINSKGYMGTGHQGNETTNDFWQYNPVTYNITASAGANGSINPPGNVSVTENNSQSFVIKPNVGYAIADVLVDGISVGAVSSFTFTNVLSPHSIFASFSLIALPAGALNFDGIDDGVLINNSASVQLNTGTAEAWIKTSNAGSSWRGIIVKQWAYSLFLYNNELICYDWSTGNVSTGVNLADNQWHHVAVSFANGVVNGSKIYVDGIVVKTFTYHLVNQSIGLSVGVGADYSVQNFTGTIDEVRVWNRQLSLAEIQNNKNCEVPVPATGLVVYYKLNQGIENANNAGINTATDASGTGNNGSLINFGLTGTTSNWVAGNINGSCAVFGSSYAITSTAAANGTISPAGNTIVVSGGSQLVSVTPNAGYQIADVLVDGISVGPVANYTFNNVTATHTISASFSLIPLPAISVSSSSINYGNLGLGFSLTDSIIITNTGTAPLNLSGITSSHPAYSILYYKNILAPNDTTRLITRYNPIVAGASSATLTITHNAVGSPTLVNVQGNAVATGYTYQVNHIAGLAENLYGATWFNNRIGFVSGANGKLYKTTDGGATWSLLPFAGNATLYSIRCIGSELWLFGSGGHICVSHDGGQTFTSFNTGTSNTFYSGYFVNGFYGFAVGSNGTLCRYNGIAWEPYNLGLPNHFYGVYAYGNSAWAVGSGGIVCRYNRACNCWQPINPGVANNIYGVGFWNESIGYIVGSGGLIYRTVNGGSSWIPCNSGVNVDIRKIRCYNANIAWAVCTDGRILQTTDGGITWVQLPLGNFNFEDVDFNGCQGIAICHNGAVITFQIDVCNTSFNPYYTRISTGTSYNYGSAWIGSPAICAVGGRYGSVSFTGNGGQSWYSTNPYTIEDINCVRVFGNSSFIAGSGGYIAKCNHLGTNWVRFGGIPQNIIFYSLAFYADGTGWAVGSGGTICFYNGTSWIPYNTGGINNTFRCVYVIGDVAYAVGTGGIICKYINGGWIDVSPGAVVTNDFYGCAFVSPLIGYAVGSGGIICKTTNGGQSWFPITTCPTNEDLHCVEVGCKLEAMVAGKNGVAFQTADGGNNWIDKSLQRPVHINSISLLDGSGLLAADDGEVYAFAFGAGKVSANIVASGPTTFCEGGSVTLTASGGSNYLWSNNQTTPAITVTEAGNYSVTVSNAAGCSDDKQQQVSVNAKPIIEFTPPRSICVNAAAITLAATPIGGTFSGVGVVGNNFDPSVAGEGAKTITYTVTSAEGCAATKDVQIQVDPLTQLAFITPASICLNGSSIGLSATPTGGLFTGTGVAGNTFIPTAAGVGIKTITYTYTNQQGCTSTAPSNIKVKDITPLVFNLPAAVCSNESPTILSASPVGGTFGGAGVISNTLYPANAGVGNIVITYTYTNADGCTSSISKSIMVNAAPIANAGIAATIYYGYTPMQCTNLTGSATGGTPGYGYSWSTGATGAAINVCPIATTSYTLTATDSKGCKATSNVTVQVVDVRCKNNKLVQVCHVEPLKQNVNICVDEHAVPTHLAHGDYLGNCIVATARLDAPSIVVKPSIEFSVYPNPSNGDFTVQLPVTKGEVTLALLNSNGVVLDLKTVRGNIGVVQYHHKKLSKGVYVVQVLSNDSLQVLKLVIQ
jgi:photosystem II stability/assembly factor-like uncharacterized protein